MILNIFPIDGPLKEPLLIIESFIVIFFLELGIIFWIRATSEEVNELKGLQEKAYGWLLLGYSIMWVFIIIGDHFVDPIYFRTLILNIGFLFHKTPNRLPISYFGYFLTTRILVELIGLEIRLFGDILQLIGLIFIALFLFSVPSFAEYEWRDQIEYLSIMHKSGLFIYQKAFKNKILSAMDESIITGTLTTIKMMLEEFGDSNSASIIRKKNKAFIIEPGKFIYGVIISNKELESLKILLNKSNFAVKRK